MKPRLLILLLVLALCAGTIGVLYRAGCYALPSTLLPEWAHRSAYPTAYADETEWLLTLTARDIAEMGAMAGRHPQEIGRMYYRIRPLAASAGISSWRIRIIGWKTWIKCDVALPFVWQSDLFQGLAADCLGGTAATTGTPDPQGGTAMLHTLLDLQPAVLATENRRVSAALNRAPADPEAHEEAALLLGAFALREHAGDFSDSRQVLCRMAAHLALAQALHPGQPLGPCGRMADLTLRALAGREADVLAAADAPTAGQASPDEKFWLQALALHVTRDWRRVTPDASTPLLLRYECFFASAQSVRPDQAIRRVLRENETSRSDWDHLVLETAFSVENGHVFAAPSLGADLEDLVAVWRAAQWPLSKDILVAALNQPETLDVTSSAGKEPTLEVLSPGTWAAFFQRHLCQDAFRTSHWMREQWGVPDQAKAYWAEASGLLGGLSRWPTATLSRQLDRHENSPVPEEWLTEIGTHPESYPLPLLNQMRPNHSPLVPKLIATYRAFYGAIAPPGSAERLDCRIMGAETFFHDLLTDAVYRNAMDLNPSDYGLRFDAACHRFHASMRSLGAAQIREAFGPLLDYNLDAMGWLESAVRNDPAAYEAVMTQKCAIDPDSYLALASYYLQQGQTDQAVDAYQKAFDQATDRVWVSNQMDWLVLHYYETGNAALAEKIAQDVAAVYSYHGLETMVHLRERQGNLAEAESYAKKIAERYNDSNALNAFYGGHREQFPEAYRQAMIEVFPEGLNKLPATLDPVAPPSGVRLLEETPATRNAGFQPGDIIVALDGYAVRNVAQYGFVRGLSTSPDMTFLVWRKDRYVPIAAHIPTRKMEVGLGNYLKKR